MLRRLVQRLRRVRNEQDGVVMVEGMIGVLAIILAALAAVQVMLVVHGALAARQAATAIAHVYALTRDPDEARKQYHFERGNSFGIIQWKGATFGAKDGMATATVTVYIPPVFPGAGIFGGGGLTSGFYRTESGAYPLSGGG